MCFLRANASNKLFSAFQSHQQLQDALDVGLLKHVLLCRFNEISKSSSPTEGTEHRPVQACVTLAFLQLMMTLKFSRNSKVPRALINQRPVLLTADDDFELFSS